MKSVVLAETALVMIDMQQKLLPAMTNGDKAAERLTMLLRGTRELGIPALVTEQYPKGLGPTVPELAAELPEGTVIAAKTGFSVFREPAFVTALKSQRRSTLIFAGIEAHVCLFQSVCHALEQGYQVLVAADAVASRKASDAALALEQMRQMGAVVMSAEAILFLLMEDAKNPHFKAISALVR